MPTAVHEKTRYRGQEITQCGGMTYPFRYEIADGDRAGVTPAGGLP